MMNVEGIMRCKDIICFFGEEDGEEEDKIYLKTSPNLNRIIKRIKLLLTSSFQEHHAYIEC